MEPRTAGFAGQPRSPAHRQPRIGSPRNQEIETSESQREKVYFRSGATICAAWHYRGTSGACIVMAAGAGVTKEPATDRFAEAFNRAGYSVVAFDFRHFGESGGEPRQVIRLREQQADCLTAINFARQLLEVDPTRVALWGFSLGGGHVFPVAAADGKLSAAVAQAPMADGQAATRNVLRESGLRASLRLTARGIADALAGLLGGAPRLVPLAGPPGSLAAVSTVDALNGDAALNPGNRYPDWQQEIAARSALQTGFYRPVRFAGRVRCPLLVIAYDDDGAATPGPAVTAAQRAPHAELVRLPGGHYAGYLAGHEEAVRVILDFLDRSVRGETPSKPLSSAA